MFSDRLAATLLFLRSRDFMKDGAVGMSMLSSRAAAIRTAEDWLLSVSGRLGSRSVEDSMMICS